MHKIQGDSCQGYTSRKERVFNTRASPSRGGFEKKDVGCMPVGSTSWLLIKAVKTIRATRALASRPTASLALADATIISLSHLKGSLSPLTCLLAQSRPYCSYPSESMSSAPPSFPQVELERALSEQTAGISSFQLVTYTEHEAAALVETLEGPTFMITLTSRGYKVSDSDFEAADV